MTITVGKMNEEKLAVLIASAERLEAALIQHRVLLRTLSDNRPHHQACRVGGLMYAGASVDGRPCWCGVDAVWPR